MKTFALILLLSSPASIFCADFAAGRQVINPYANTNTIPALEQGKREQLEAAKSWKAFHDFQFTDRYEESGIRFEPQPVDDASKTYLAVHYDHGNGLAVADVDGDGKLDAYFVNQLGESQLWRNVCGGKFENITSQAGV